MEKRDMIVIVVAIFIVLIMAMYIKPLVTGKEAKLIPDEIAGLFAQKNNTSLITDNYSQNNGTANISKFSNNTTSNNTPNIGQINQTSNQSNMTKGSISPTPTQWDGKPINVKSAQISPTPLQTRISVYLAPTPEPAKISMASFATLAGNKSQIFGPIEIPTGYWEINYTVNYKPSLGNPSSGNIFEFNKQYKESSVAYEGEPKVIYDGNGNAIDIVDTKSEKKIENSYSSSKEKVLIKEPNEDWVLGKGEPFTASEGTATSNLVESISYGIPDITLIIKSLDNPKKTDIIVKPGGGIDPLQWNEEWHRKKAEDDLKQQGKTDLLNSALYKEEWDKKWKSIKDPRPWNEKIYGKGSYIIEVYPKNIDNYNINILIPTTDYVKPLPTTTLKELTNTSSQIILKDVSYDELWRNNNKYIDKIIQYHGIIIRKENETTYIFKPDSWNQKDIHENIMLTGLNQIRLRENDPIFIEGTVEGLENYQQTAIIGLNQVDQGVIELPKININSVTLE